MKFLQDLRRGAVAAVGFMLTLGLTAVVAQTISSFSSGEVVSAGSINTNFAQVKSAITGVTNRLGSPLPVQFVDPATVNVTSGSLTDVPGFTMDVTTAGEPVWVGLTSKPGGPSGLIQITSNGAASGCDATLAILRNGNIIYSTRMRFTHSIGAGGAISMHYIPSAIWTIDSPGSGTHTYKIQLRDSSGGGACVTIQFEQVRMIAWRILPQ